MADFTVIDHTAEVLSELDRRIYTALEACGINAVSHAQVNIDRGVPRHGGSWYRSRGEHGLKGTISHLTKLNEKTVYVGTNADHAIYNEYGTGKYASNGNGRKGWWVYVPNSNVRGKGRNKTYTKQQAFNICKLLRAKGLDAHATEGMEPLHFLKNAVADHKEEYHELLKQFIHN